MIRAAVNVHGPVGEFVLAGDPLPELPGWFIESLLASGGAVEESE